LKSSLIIDTPGIQKNCKKILDSPSIYASGGQKPFYKKGSGLPKIFHWDGLNTLFFFVFLCVPLWLKIGGGFRGNAPGLFFENFGL
jgi:hypothetical protein